MKDIIRLLPDSIANQIAAGEVVQRPSSVVKELMENAIDAGATQIEVIIKEGGKTFIQIIDNGIGMSETDARMCFERHATSKIDSSDDLFKLTTLGFRGEALASIAAVAQVDLKTKRQQDEIGTQLIIEGSTFKSQEPVQFSGGTSITVKNLFFNVPARRNFLKSNAVETKHILEEFQRLALAYPTVHFSFYEQDEEMYSLPSSKLSQRIVNLFGKSYQEQLVACSESTDLVKIEGYIGKPEFSKKTRGEQFFFVNKRFIKSSYLHHAVIGAFEGLLPEGSFPFYVLFIEINPAFIDVNVHPTKTEIKFEDEKMVYAILRAAVRRSLSVNHVTPSLDFEQSINLMDPLDLKNKSNQTSISSYSKKNNSFDTDLYYSSFSQESNLIIPSESNEKIESSSLIKIEETKPAPYQLHQRYIIASIKSGCMMIDQCAAYERILYDKYNAYSKQETIPSQQLLFPQTIQLNPVAIQIVMDMEQEIKSLGFGFEFFGKDTIVMNGIPCDILLGEEKEWIEELINQFQYYASDSKLSKNEKMIQFIAKKASSRYEIKLLPQEMSSLIDKLFACSNPNYSPSGKRIYITWDMNGLGSLFK